MEMIKNLIIDFYINELGSVFSIDNIKAFFEKTLEIKIEGNEIDINFNFNFNDLTDQEQDIYYDLLEKYMPHQGNLSCYLSELWSNRLQDLQN